MMNGPIKKLILLALFFATPAFAVNCQRSATPLENTICTNDNLHWLDSTMTVIYRTMLLQQDALRVRQQYEEWERSLKRCTSDGCIERAYYVGISMLSDVAPSFNWEGQWWNMLAPNMSGGVIQFSRSTEWSVTSDIRVWAGMNKDEFTAEARKYYGMAVVEKITDTNSCRLLFIPKKDGAIQVYSNTDWGCRISMPIGAFIDGRYERAEQDPRPAPTLLSLGILPTAALDEKFRTLVGADYQNFVDTANVYIYQDDLDNIGASVVSMWVRGAANRETAIIMYTPAQDIWAARISPDKNGVTQMHYFSTKSNDLRQMPRTLAGWRQRYLDK